MKRVGIITHYYKNINYGGALQSYALVAYLNRNGFSAEQISYPLWSYANFLCGSAEKESRIKRIMRHPIKSALSFLSALCGKDKARRKALEERHLAFYKFREKLTPHSNRVYEHGTIDNCINDYDIFVTGSDQVWNFSWYNPAFFLDFVPEGKTKIAYAASIGSSDFSDEQKEIVKNSIIDFKAVSVREKSAVKILSRLTDKAVYNTIDPTLLLERERWEEICAPRLYEEGYVFCYFLGSNSAAKACAHNFAIKHGLKTVYIPYANYDKDKIGEKYADALANNVSPEKFLSLVKHADYVFTDSFHAIVFSYLFSKRFYVFHRSETGEMSDRINDFCSLIGASDRFCRENGQVNLAYLESIDKEPDYLSSGVDELKDKSVKFIRENFN